MEVVVWDFKGEEGNSRADGKSKVWETNGVWPSFTMGHREEFDQKGPTRFLPDCHS